MHFFFVCWDLRHLKKLPSPLTCIWFYCIWTICLRWFYLSNWNIFSFQGHMAFVISCQFFSFTLLDIKLNLSCFFSCSVSSICFNDIFGLLSTSKYHLFFSFANQIFALKLKKQMTKKKRKYCAFTRFGSCRIDEILFCNL